MKVKPTTDRMVSITVHDFKVCTTDMPKNSLIIQKPASLTWDKMSDPAPVASTANSMFTPGVTARTGAMMREEGKNGCDKQRNDLMSDKFGKV